MSTRCPTWGEVLTRRELEITVLAARGYSNAEIADNLHVSPRTVEAHFRSIYPKMGVPNRTALTALYLKDPEESMDVMANDASVRLTVDLAAELHKEFRRWSLTTAVQLGITRVTLTDAMRAMVELTTTDAATSARVVKQLEQRAGSAQ